MRNELSSRAGNTGESLNVVMKSQHTRPVWNDSVATPPRLARKARRLSDDHVDGVAWAWRRAYAIDPNLKFRKVRKPR
jgi:hypothetical protein